MARMSRTNLEGCCRFAEVDAVFCQNSAGRVKAFVVRQLFTLKRFGMETQHIHSKDFSMAYLQQSDVNSNMSKGNASLSKANKNLSKGGSSLTKSQSIKQVPHWVLGVCVGD